MKSMVGWGKDDELLFPIYYCARIHEIGSLYVNKKQICHLTHFSVTSSVLLNTLVIYNIVQSSSIPRIPSCTIEIL